MISRLNKFISTGAASVAGMGLATAASAQDSATVDDIDSVGLSDLLPFGDNSLEFVVTDFINIAIGFVALVAVAVLIYGGFLIIMAAGNEEMYDKGKRLVITAIVGLGLIFISWGLTVWVINNLLAATGA